MADTLITKRSLRRSAIQTMVALAVAVLVTSCAVSHSPASEAPKPKEPLMASQSTVSVSVTITAKVGHKPACVVQGKGKSWSNITVGIFGRSPVKFKIPGVVGWNQFQSNNISYPDTAFSATLTKAGTYEVITSPGLAGTCVFSVAPGKSAPGKTTFAADGCPLVSEDAVVAAMKTSVSHKAACLFLLPGSNESLILSVTESSSGASESSCLSRQASAARKAAGQGVSVTEVSGLQDAAYVFGYPKDGLVMGSFIHGSKRLNVEVMGRLATRYLVDVAVLLRDAAPNLGSAAATKVGAC